MNRISQYTLQSHNSTDTNLYTAGFIRLESSAMSKCNLDINSGSQLPMGKYTIRELNLEIEVVSSDDNRYQFWII